MNEFTKKYLKLALFLTLALTLLVSVFRFRNLLQNSTVQEFVGEQIQKITQGQVNTPGLLRAKQESPQAFLTVAGVIKYTNIHRVENNLPPLKENNLLDQSALIKAKDMLDQQYFEHESPDGKGVEDLTKEAGYSYLTIGENLALGNFLNDKELVQGWMDSPGHRANILNSSYKEIGVGVIKGTFEGKVTWLAVQHFGRPLSDCPGPSTSLKQTIDTNESRLDQLQDELNAMKTDLENTPRNDPSYNQKVEAYNAKVNEYNTLLESTKKLIDQFNTQVNAFNACASG
ncbi:hypothetical protein HYT59_01635 [Candidatus Woesebacteria bacterium]|nr:hypothetical protein [Candidatus Woesebacteria bacterium]